MEPNENLKVSSNNLISGTKYIVKEIYYANEKEKKLSEPKIFIGRYNRRVPEPNKQYYLEVFQVVEGRGHIRDISVRSINHFYLIRPQLKRDITAQIKKEAMCRRITRKQRLNEELMEKSLARQKNMPEDVSRYLKEFIMKEQKIKGGKIKTKKL
jgi:hypothetical protein